MAMDVHWTRGYTRGELEAAQERFDLRFPPDLLDLLLDRRPVEGWDWRLDHEEIERVLAWPEAGILFDVEENDFWLREWGERPLLPASRAEIVASAVRAAPRLLPIIAHRYIPTEPHEAGNPVFSVWQSDVIYYGANLAEYFKNEFDGHFAVSPARHIPFWSELAKRQG